VPAILDKLLSQTDKRILFVGIGNVLKQDDGVGVYISSKIKETSYILSLTVEVSIENYIGKINSLNPDILVLIDCADLDSPPGTWNLIPVSDIKDLTFNTHNISLKRLSDFFNVPVFVLGIQPVSIDFGENISYLVKNIADWIILQINNQEVHYGYRISM
jgi:hydrogenase 3 maturation protease